MLQTLCSEESRGLEPDRRGLAPKLLTLWSMECSSVALCGWRGGVLCSSERRSWVMAAILGTLRGSDVAEVWGRRS